MVKLTVVGSLNYDLVTYTQRVPAGGETYKADSFETHIGGKGLNQTIAIAKLIPEINEDNKVRLIGSVGSDSFGEELIQSLKQYGISTDDISIIEDESSGVATILVEKSTGENRILICEGANSKTEFDNAQLDELFPVDSKDREIIVFQNEIPGTLNIIKWLKSNRSSIEIVYNPSPYYSYSVEILRLIDVLIVNEIESMSIAKDILPIDEFESFQRLIHLDPINGFTELSQTLKQKIDLNGASLIIITLGPIGSVVTLPNNRCEFIKSIKIDKVIDTTGAGDTFLGAILTQRCLGVDIKSATEFATFSSSLAIQKKGASNSIPTYKEVLSKRSTTNI